MMLASLTAMIIWGVVMLGVVGGIIFLIIYESDLTKLDIKENTVIVIKLNTEIYDRARVNPFEDMDLFVSEMGLNDILYSIEQAKEDENIKGILLNVTEPFCGTATIEEIRNALIDFKESGKFIYSYSNIYTTRGYYLCSVADKIYISPEGMVGLVGLSSMSIFYYEALKKLGVEPQMIRQGKYKSAIEPYTRTEMSEANRHQRTVFVNSLWGYMLKGIQETRNLSPETLNQLADSLTAGMPRQAVDAGLIDDIKYRDQIVSEMEDLAELEEDEELNLTTLSNYIKYTNLDKDDPDDFDEQIAVIYATGEIRGGSGGYYEIAANTFAKAIKQAREDEDVKAVVLRVNSPGGSAMASEVIWREIILTKEEKPVIVSFGDLAASGGYYIACPADVIVTNHTTLTGSIGVFGLSFSVKELINDKLGIYVDVVKTNAHSDMGSIHRPLSEKERKTISGYIEQTYQIFLEHVADGRDMSVADVDSIAQGRIWSGDMAIDIGLADQYGGLKRSIEIAAEEAGLSEYGVLELPYIDPLKEFFGQYPEAALTAKLKEELGPAYTYYRELGKLMQSETIQARLPYDIEVK